MTVPIPPNLPTNGARVCFKEQLGVCPGQTRGESDERVPGKTVLFMETLICPVALLMRAAGPWRWGVLWWDAQRVAADEVPPRRGRCNRRLRPHLGVPSQLPQRGLRLITQPRL